jgi:hypothetical protein
MENTNIQAVRHGKQVHVIVDTDMYQRSFDEQDSAVALYNQALTARTNPTTVNVELLLDEVLPGRKLIADNVFTIKNGEFFLTGYETVAMPEELVVRIQAHIEQEISVQPLVNFWKLLLLNPDAQARKDTFKFMSEYDFPITDSGYFIGYRSVRKTDKTYDAVTGWVPQKYVELKATGESPADYTAMTDPDGGEFVAVKTDVITDTNGNFISPEHVLGNLEEMFTNQTTGVTDAPEYTDWHSGTTSVRLGGTVSMDRASVDCNPSNTCSSGLHIGAPGYVKNFGGGSDNVHLACLVNPMNVCAIPSDYSYQKMRVCEYYAYGIVDLSNDMEIRTPYFELDYKTFEQRELDKQLEEYEAIIEDNKSAVTARAIISERRVYA